MNKLTAYLLNGFPVGLSYSSWSGEDLGGNDPFRIEGTVSVGYQDISSIENWDNYGVIATDDTLLIRDEISNLYSGTFSDYTTSEKEILSKFFIAKKGERDSVKTESEQLEDARYLAKKIQLSTSETEEGLLHSNGTFSFSDRFHIKEYFSNEMLSINGNFNGISCIRAGQSSLNNRWRFRSFGGLLSDQTVIQVNGILPENFVENSIIDLNFNWTTDGTTGSVTWNVGLLFGTNRYTGELLTEYKSRTVKAPNNSKWQLKRFGLTFGTTGVSASAPYSVIVYRDGNGLLDDLTNTAYLYNFRMKTKVTKIRRD